VSGSTELTVTSLSLLSLTVTAETLITCRITNVLQAEVVKIIQ